MKFPTLDYAVSGRVATITLNRPERRNALDIEFFENLIAALAAAEDDSGVQVVVLAASGPVFCAGQNLKFTAAADGKTKERYSRINVAGRERIRKLRKPVVARVQGDALGGGSYIVTACDLIVAVRGARLALREIHAGEESGGAFLFSIGRARAMEMSLLGGTVTAEVAEQWGLINRAVSPEDLDSAVGEYVSQLLALPPLGLESTKASQNLLLDMAGFGAHVESSVARNRFLFTTADAREARLSFVQKRRPKFTGS